MRAIDGDKLLRDIEKYHVSDGKFQHWVQIQPTIEPQRKKGKWIYGESEAGNDGYYCSKCGNFVPWKYDEYDIDFIKEFLFCNKCGADMRELEDIPMEYFENGGR